ncbi:hypothetical protein ACQEVY_30605 [Streptomyces sp. CA-288835]|uniref:hypothetical protein n=1 Tax=Streptomyces sp. CA-288835 TaxID=3240069 RepID=UPI003D8F86E9
MPAAASSVVRLVMPAGAAADAASLSEVSGRGRAVSSPWPWLSPWPAPADGGVAGASIGPGSDPSDPSVTALRTDDPPVAADGSVLPAAEEPPDDPSGEDRL